MSLLEFKVLVSAAACAVETGLFASRYYLHCLLIMKSLLPTTKLKFHHPIVFLIKAVFQVAALVILASG
jgi:hypothetical protein